MIFATAGRLLLATLPFAIAAENPTSRHEAPSATNQAQKGSPEQRRLHGSRVVVPATACTIDDGDTVRIRWPNGDVETVRILGVDSPEIRHLEHEIPYAQPFGPEAAAFATGAFVAATTVELLRSNTLDSYGRSLGYFFLNGNNYSLLLLKAGLAEENVTHYGDNGLPTEADAVRELAQKLGPRPFESPHVYRERMRRLSRWMKSKGIYPSH